MQRGTEKNRQENFKKQTNVWSASNCYSRVMKPLIPFNLFLCPQTPPIPIPLAPLSTLVPQLRCSVEGLNQELEGMFICQPPHPQHRVNATNREKIHLLRKEALNIMVTVITCVKQCFIPILAASRSPRWSPGSSPSTELQQWISEWPHLSTTVLILVLLTKSPSRPHLHLPTHFWRCTTRYSPRLVSKY